MCVPVCLLFKRSNDRLARSSDHFHSLKVRTCCIQFICFNFCRTFVSSTTFQLFRINYDKIFVYFCLSSINLCYLRYSKGRFLWLRNRNCSKFLNVNLFLEHASLLPWQRLSLRDWLVGNGTTVKDYSLGQEYSEKLLVGISHTHEKVSRTKQKHRAKYIVISRGDAEKCRTNESSADTNCNVERDFASI